MPLKIVRNDITKMSVDAIVKWSSTYSAMSANSLLLI